MKDSRGSMTQGSAEALLLRRSGLCRAARRKEEDKCFTQKIAWIDQTLGLKKSAVVHVAGALDMGFVEFILASYLTREMIVAAGHN